MTKTLDPMVLKVTKPVVVLPLVGVNRAFAKGPSICVAQPDSKTKAQEKITSIHRRSCFLTKNLSKICDWVGPDLDAFEKIEPDIRVNAYPNANQWHVSNLTGSLILQKLLF